MRVISKKALSDFWKTPDYDDSEQPLRAWYKIVNDRELSWTFWGDLKATFGSADKVGDCVVFDIGGNKYRLIAKIRYKYGRVYVRKVMVYKEYDSGKWKDACGCTRQLQQRKTNQSKKATPLIKKSSRRKKN